MDPVYSSLATATLAVGAEVSFGSVATLQDFWDVFVDTSNVGGGGQIEARLYGQGPSGQKILMGTVGIAPVPKRTVMGITPCARETFDFPQSLLGIAGFQPEATRTGSVSWELRLVALNPQAAVSVSAILAGYSFSEPFGNDSIESAATVIPAGSAAIMATMTHQSEFHDIAANFAQAQEPLRFELFASAGTAGSTLTALIAQFDCPLGFSPRAITVMQGKRGVGASVYTLLATNLGVQTVTLTTVFDGYDNVGAGGGSGSQNLTQPIWHINALTGSDANDGLTAGTALQTLAELTQNRWGTGAVLEPTSADRSMQVLVDSSIPPTDPLILDVVLGEDVSLIFRGTAFTTIFSGALTATTPLNRVANQSFNITDAAAPWGANTGQRIRNTTAGVRLNSVAYIAADLGAGVARINPPWITLFAGNIPVFLSAGGFVALDTYDIESLPTITVANVAVQSYAGVSGAAPPTINFVDLDVGADPNAFAPFNIGAGTSLSVFASRFPQADVFGGTDTWFNAMFKDGVLRFDGVAGGAIFGGLSLNALGFFAAGGVGSSLILSLDFTVQGSGLQLFGSMLIDDVGVFDSPTNGANTNATLAFCFVEVIPFLGTGAFYGVGNANVGVHLGHNSAFVYANAAALTITGTAAGDFECGAVGVLNTPDPASWNFTGAIAQTWANLAAARAAGFGGTVINPVNMARILPFFA